MDSKKFLGLLIPRVNFYLWINLFLVAVIAILDWRVAIPGFVLLAFLFYYNIHSSYKSKAEISNFIENLNFNIDTATRDTLLNFPMPLVITELDGSIVWYNSSFKAISEKSSFEGAVKSIVNDLKKNELAPDNLKNFSTGYSKQLGFEGRSYNVLCNLVRQDQKPEAQGYILILYFIDVTELADLKKAYYNEKIMTGIFVVDNYDDLMQSMPDSSRPQMLAEIDRKLVQWMSFTNGVLKKYERDKYLFLFEQKHLK